MEFTHVCIVTNDVKRLKLFYKDIFQINESVALENYIEFNLGSCILAIFDKASHEALAPGSVETSSNRCVMMEFKVDDVDAEYARLSNMDINWVKHPTVQPWGNKSIYFRDPDENLINFYSKVLI